MAKRGRKSKAEELQILDRYAELSGPYFAVIQEALKSSRVSDKRWAADHLKIAFAKMIPQDVGGHIGDLPFSLIIKPRDDR